MMSNGSRFPLRRESRRVLVEVTGFQSFERRRRPMNLLASSTAQIAMTVAAAVVVVAGIAVWLSTVFTEFEYRA
jgi:hypothetical protein